MRIPIVLIATLIMIAPPLSAAENSSTLDQIKKSGKIRIGFRQSEPPMSFLDGNGNPVGYSIDLCSRIVTAVKTELNKTDLSVEYLPVNAKTRFSALSDNEIDILCGSTTKTLSRGKLVDFTQLTFVTGASLLSMAGNPVNGIADLQGKKVAVVKNTTTIEVLKAALKEALTDEIGRAHV